MVPHEVVGNSVSAAGGGAGPLPTVSAHNSGWGSSKATGKQNGGDREYSSGISEEIPDSDSLTI